MEGNREEGRRRREGKEVEGNREEERREGRNTLAKSPNLEKRSNKSL